MLQQHDIYCFADMDSEVKGQLPAKGLEHDFSHYARALAHPARISILLEMIKSNGVVEGKVVEVEGMSPSTVIQHLRELKRSGIIDGRIFGLRSKYWIEKEALAQFRQLSFDLFFKLETLA